MFEKEAEEYLKKDGTKAEQILDMLNKISPLKITLKQVPFILAMIQQVFIDGAEFVYNKANEWHEIASKRTPKGEISKKYMPKNKEKVLLKYHFSGDDEIHISDGYYDAYDLEFHIANNPKYRIVCVIAWKELQRRYRNYRRRKRRRICERFM